MPRLSIVFVVALSAMSGAAQTTTPRPVAALPVVRHWQAFTDPREGAFTVEMPLGWKTSGGTARRNALQYRGWVVAVSPDGSTILAINDPSEPSYVAPSQMMTASGFRIGSVYDGGGGTSYIVAPYQFGEQYAMTWGQRVLRTLCGDIRLASHRSRPDLTQQVNGRFPAFGIVHNYGEATFNCDRNGEGMTAYVFMSTTAIGQSGLWYSDTIESFLTPAPFAGLAAELLAHMVKSVRVNPAWVLRQSKTNVDVSHIAAETNAMVSDSIMRSWEQNSATIDRLRQEESRTRLGIDVYADPATGTQYTVSNQSSYYWVNAAGTVVGTNTDTPPAGGGFTRLNRVPPQ